MQPNFNQKKMGLPDPPPYNLESWFWYVTISWPNQRNKLKNKNKAIMGLDLFNPKRFPTIILNQQKKFCKQKSSKKNSNQKMFWPKFFSDQIFFFKQTSFLKQHFFRTKTISDRNFFKPNVFRTKIFLRTTFIYQPQFFWTEKTFQPTKFSDKKF